MTHWQEILKFGKGKGNLFSAIQRQELKGDDRAVIGTGCAFRETAEQSPQQGRSSDNSGLCSPKAPNIIAVIKRLGFYSFPSVSDVPHLPKRTCCVRRCTRLRLVSDSPELKFVMTWWPVLFCDCDDADRHTDLVSSNEPD